MADPRTPGAAAPQVAVFGPHPLLTVTVERQGDADDVHLHAGGQGVWVSRMAAELGARPVLCGLLGGETGSVLRPLLAALGLESHLVPAPSSSGCVVIDRRDGERRVVAARLAGPAARHEVDDLVSLTCAAALGSRSLVVCNPYPGDTLPLEVYATVVADAKGNGVPVLVDLSSPRLDSALEGRPDVVKLNDWELAEYVRDSVDGMGRRRRAAERLLAAGAGAVIVTRGPDPALVLRADAAWELIPPRFERGRREGCGDTMMGALAAALACGLEWERALALGAAAGAANFLRHGLGSGDRAVVDEIAGHVELRRL
ncbi:MAG TPA: PfkB family carbohydrate kinase [Solirubrobacteraceae bacterium]|nr:PfkB family carbohydrate kinase [Solirubrobacteraceae bacterium]